MKFHQISTIVSLTALLTACSSVSGDWPDDQQQTGARITLQDQDILLKEHNRVRKDVNLGPMKWSTELAGVAQEWSEVLANGKCSLQHRANSAKKWHKPGLGENLFMGTDGYYTVGSAVTAWEDEKKDYDQKPINLKKFMAYGHYTQIVWKSTTEVGCGKAYCNGNLIVACNYSPPGNYIGQMPF